MPNATPQAIWFGVRCCDKIARIRFEFLLIRENIFLPTLRGFGNWGKHEPSRGREVLSGLIPFKERSESAAQK
jgi:hypothetical protein